MALIPQTLADETSKRNWSHEDCFGSHEDEYIRAFIHHSYSIGMHTHSFYEINIVVGGKGVHYIEGKSFPARTGCVFVIPPNVRHGYYQEQALDVYHVLMGCGFIDRYAHELSHLPGYPVLFEIEPYLRGEFATPLFLVLDGGQMERLSPLLQALVHSCALPYPGKEILKNAQALCLVGELCHYIKAAAPEGQEASAAGLHYPAIVRSMEYIHRHYREKITVETLASRVYLSRSTFIRSFKGVCNTAPMEYVTAYRIRKAGEMLRLSDKSVTRIAQECGFYDGSHFQKYFMRCHHTSPCQYRKEHRPQTPS